MIAVIDYGMGNLASISKGLEFVGGDVKVTANPVDIIRAEKIVLPGVGAFKDGIAHLMDSGMARLLEQEVVEKKKPLLGICLGMQLLAKMSYEFGEHQGLGFIDAEVKRLDDAVVRVPHVGWNAISLQRPCPLFAGVGDAIDVYFVHSYYVQCADDTLTVATCDYGHPFTAALQSGNIFATQFHPEKSQRYGLKMLENFVRL